MEQKILYVLEAKDRGLNAQLTDAREQVRRLSAELRKTKDGSDEYKRLTGEVVRAKDEVSKLAKEQRQFTRDMEAMKAPKDSLIGLRHEYSKLSAQIAQLSEAERKGSFGKALIRNAKSVKSEIDGIEQSIGRFTGNVGNYKSALAGLGDAITGGLVTGGVVVAVEKLLGLMKQGVDQAVKYEKALDDLSALTGVTGQGLKELQGVEQALRKIEVGGAEIVNTGPEILESLKLVGGARPELLKDADALGAVAKEAIILSKASGDDLPSSVTALTTVLGQFSLKAKDSGRVINELAAGAKAGASEIPDTTDALKEFGTTAKSVNATTSESVALIQLLADRQLKGSEAGTQLRNVLTKLAAADVLPRTAQDEFKRYGVNINILKDASLPLVDRLKELAKVQGDVGALTKIFGLENLQAANIITDGVGKYTDLQKAIEGTNEAYKQAEIRSDNAATKIENLKNKVLNGLQESMENASPTIDAVSGSLGFLIEKMGAIDGVFTLAIGPIKQVIDAFYRTKDAIGSLFGEVDNATKQAAQTDNVSAELQDQLDRAAQFNERGRELYLERVSPRKPKSGTKGESAPKTIDNEAKAAAGSIAFLEKKVKDLTDALNKAPEGKIDEIIGKLVPAEKELKDAKDYVEFLKSGGYGGRAPIDFLPTKQDLETALTEAQRLFDERKLKVDVELQRVTGDLIKGASSDAANKSESQRIAEGLKTEEDAAKRSIEIKEALRDASISIAEETSAALFSIRQNEIDQQLEQQLSALDAQTEARIKAAGNDQTAIDAIKADSDKKRLALEAEAARKRKELAIKEALINTALAVTKALTGAPPPFNAILAAASLASGLAQVAVIRKQQFAKGGKVIPVSGPSHAGGGVQGSLSDGTQFEVEGGEQLFVLKKNDKQSIAALSDENVRRGGVSFFADTTPGAGFGTIPQRVLPGQTAAQGRQAIDVSMSDENIEMFANVVAARVAETAGQKVKDGVVTGLDSANRLREREAEMQEKRAL